MTLTIRTIAVAVAVAFVGTLSLPHPATAASTTFPVAYTTNGVYLRVGPSMSYAKSGNVLPNGTPVTVACEQVGANASNTAGQTSPIWERLTNGLWIANAYVATGADGWTPGIPRCSYTRTAAATWADGNYKGDAAGVSNDAECAWFASHALWAGGVAMGSDWTDDASTSVDVVNANALVNYLSSTGRATTTKLSWRDPTAGGASLGDIIAYDLYPKNPTLIDHVAVVTSFTSKGYPNVTQRSPAQRGRYWSWSLSKNKSIEVAYPGSSAYLVHVK